MMRVHYADQALPQRFARSLFLAGPSPRAAHHLDWRPAALAELEARGYEGVVFIPLPADGAPVTDYTHQVEWEAAAMEMSDVLLFWVPRALDTLPGFTTNVEWGRWEASGRVVLGYPQGAPKMRYLHHHAARRQTPVAHTLADTVAAALSALEALGPPALREGGERGIPLDLWGSPVFQRWYAAQRQAGHRLDRAWAIWAHRVGAARFLALWSLRVDVHIPSEGRNKRSELLFGRPDVAAVVLFCPGPDPRVALIREFRACGGAADGFVHELPGGSVFRAVEDMAAVAAEELEEELGLALDSARLVPVGVRQINATLSAHRGHVYAAELSEAEMDRIAADPGPHGAEGSTEITWPEVRRLSQLLTDADVDWANMGMILQAFRRR